jgi:hypothetical protein
MRRRDFVTLIGGAAALPLAARAQQGNRIRRIGVLMGPYDENDPVTKIIVSAFTQALADLGWTDGRNTLSLRRRQFLAIYPLAPPRCLRCRALHWRSLR